MSLLTMQSLAIGPVSTFESQFLHFSDILQNPGVAERLRSATHFAHDYALAKPFPHAVLEDALPKSVLDAVNQEVPDESPLQKELGCTAEGYCYDPSLGQAGKFGYRNTTHYGSATLAVFTYMQSPAFLRFLVELTGIEGLEVDPTFSGAGVHQTLPGGFLEVHADFNLLFAQQLHRRVNVFLYLNPDWPESYGGHLELWSADLARCEARIAPNQGKLVVFSTTHQSYHGHQERLNCPQHRSRRSLAMYYYTKSRPAEECEGGDCYRVYSTQFKETRCASCGHAEFYRPVAVNR
jgi:hypothetical protein